MKRKICRAEGCENPIHPMRLMCPLHWDQVPDHLQDQVHWHYQRGREEGRHPTTGFVRAVTEAVNSVNEKERV